MKLIEWYFRAVVIESPPSRGAWIEINMPARPWFTAAVAPLAGGVD